MALLKTVYTVILSQLAVQVVQSQDPAALCGGPINRQTWLTGNIDGFLTNFGTDRTEDIEVLGYQNFLIRNHPTVAAVGYGCGPDATCDTGPLIEKCTDNPELSIALLGMANWSNFWQSTLSLMTQASQFIETQIPLMEGIFNPFGDTASPNARLDLARLGLVTTKVMLAVASLFPPATPVNGGFSIVVANRVWGAIQQAFRVGTSVVGDPNLPGNYDAFANILSSTLVLRQVINDSIKQFISDQLNDRIVFDETEKNIIGQLGAGEFAEPAAGLDNADRDRLTAAMASPAINRIWNSIQVVIVRYGTSTLSSGANPCDSAENLIFEGVNVCDSDNTALVLRKVPSLGNLQALQELNPEHLGQASPFDVGGVDNLADFGLSKEVVMRTAVQNQELDGLLQVPAEDQALIQRLLDESLPPVAIQEMVFIVLPVCDATLVEITPAQREQCRTRFQQDPAEIAMCEFNLFLLCACPELVFLTPTEQWPYDTRGAPQCA